MAKQTQQMIKGTLILSIAGILAKIISVFYKMPLVYLVGTEGLSYYQMVYPLYALLTAAGLIGIPNSVSKLVAEEVKKGEYRKAHQTFQYALLITGGFGIIVSFILFFFNQHIINMADWSNGTYYVFMGFSISPFFIAVAGAIRGYFQGMQIMVHTAVSQVVENLFKVIIGIGLVVFLKSEGYSLPVAVGGAALGASIGFVISSFYLTLVYLRKRQSIKARISIHEPKQKFSDIAKKIGIIAIPVTITSAALSIVMSIDSFTLPKLMNSFVVGDVTGKLVLESEYINGLIGKALTVINVPLVLSVSLIISIVPSISAANVDHNKTELKNKIAEAIQIAMKLSLPAAVGIYVLAEPILMLVYPKYSEGSNYLEIYALCLVFMILSQSLIGIMQGLSKFYQVLWIVIGSAIVKILLNIVLIKSSLRGFGALYGTLGYYIIIVLLCYYYIRKYTKFKLNVVHTYIKPLIASCVMGVFSWVGYKVVHSLIHSNAMATLGSVIIGIFMYVIVMIVLKAFSRDELMILPKHDKIIEIMERKGFIEKEG